MQVSCLFDPKSCQGRRNSSNFGENFSSLCLCLSVCLSVCVCNYSDANWSVNFLPKTRDKCETMEQHADNLLPGWLFPLFLLLLFVLLSTYGCTSSLLEPGQQSDDQTTTTMMHQILFGRVRDVELFSAKETRKKQKKGKKTDVSGHDTIRRIGVTKRSRLAPWFVQLLAW